MKSITRAWDHFWDVTQHIGLHSLGAQIQDTGVKAVWVRAADELHQSGTLTRAQIYRITELVEATAAVVKAQYEQPQSDQLVASQTSKTT